MKKHHRFSVVPSLEVDQDVEKAMRDGLAKGINVADFAQWIQKKSKVRMTPFIPALRTSKATTQASISTALIWLWLVC